MAPGAGPSTRHPISADKERRMQRTRSILSGIAAALLAVTAPQAIAQEQPQQPQAQPTPQPPPMTRADFSQQQIEAFADAAVEMQRIQSELDAKGRQAGNLDEITRLQQEAQADATQAVEDSGLSVQEYKAIVQAANQDPRLYATIVDLMQRRAPQ
jgi:predicted ATPase with chaperone activity